MISKQHVLRGEMACGDRSSTLSTASCRRRSFRLICGLLAFLAFGTPPGSAIAQGDRWAEFTEATAIDGFGPLHWCLGCIATPQRKAHFNFSVGETSGVLVIDISQGADDTGDRGVDVFVYGPPSRTLLRQFNASSERGLDTYRVPFDRSGGYTVTLSDDDTSSSGATPGNGGSITVRVEPGPPSAGGGSTVPLAAFDFEDGVNRGGSDLRSLVLPEREPRLCFEACQAESGCKAWTYVESNAKCWLKHSVPPAQKNACCVSGVMGAQSAGSAATEQPSPPKGPTPPPAPAPAFEFDVNRGGSDQRSFIASDRDPAQCFEACEAEPGCKAWTFVKSNAKCWLKHSVPPAQRNTCCVSGIKGTTAAAPAATGPNFEPNVNRGGSDLRSFIASDRDPAQCFEACEAEPGCKAWTYVKSNAKCWLKHSVPPAQTNDCCVSGVKASS